MDDSEVERRIAAMAALDQPLRRRLYRLLRRAGRWTTRDDAAAALDVPRSVAAFHLDKLADAGVVDVRFERTSGRRGPGAGRPAKLYRPRGEEVSASVPARRYDLAGSVLAAAVAEASRTGAPVERCVHEAAGAAGRRIGQEAHAAAAGEATGTGAGAGAGADPRPAVTAVLTELGYEPDVDPGGHRAIALANCPFHQLAEQQRELVCGMNRDFLAGVLDGLGATGELAAALDPQPGWCCVRLTPPSGRRQTSGQR